MGPVAHALIRENFGKLTEKVLTQPSYLSGYFFHVPGIGSEKLANFTLLTWRRNLDYWMNQEAQNSGVEVWQGVRAVNKSFKSNSQNKFIPTQRDRRDRKKIRERHIS